MRVLLIAVLGLALSACNLIYKLPTRQGNVIEQKQLDQLKLGQTRDQVLFLMGTPIAASPFRADRWDYVGYYKSPRGQVASRTVTLFFEGDSLARMDGVAAPADTATVGAPTSAKQLIREQKKDEVDAERAAEPTESGVILTPPGTPAP
ncbi:MAG: outer membrane protein assembly factor BamE [Stagnimonas sp.]|nr:outer membrane protein assembly factor BamE [Stagnimonas sp.]